MYLLSYTMKQDSFFFIIMKKILYYIIISILSCLIFACKERSGTNLRSDDTVKKETLTVNIGNQNKTLIFNFAPIEKLDDMRIWKKIRIKQKIKIGSINDETFFFPCRIRLDENDNIYVLDIKDYSVKMFNNQGKFIKKFGKEGQGPGELVNPFDFDVYPNGMVVILGVNDNKLVVFDNNNFIDIKTTLMPMRVCFKSTNEIITFQIFDPLNSTPLKSINIVDKKITDFQNLLSKKSFNGKDYGLLPFLFGDIHRYKLNNLVYVSAILGYVVVFDDNGKIKKVFKLLDKVVESITSKREIKDGELQMIAFPKQKEYLINSSNVFNDYLYTVSNQAKRKSNEFVIDVYSLSKGSYEYSFILNNKEKFIEGFFTDREIYIAQENTEVVVFEYSLID